MEESVLVSSFPIATDQQAKYEGGEDGKEHGKSGLWWFASHSATEQEKGGTEGLRKQIREGRWVL